MDSHNKDKDNIISMYFCKIRKGPKEYITTHSDPMSGL